MDNNTKINRLLGYPADARLLILNVDDFGMCHSMNMAALRMLRSGIATSTTIMAPCPWAVHARELLKENPDLPHGVHLTVVSEQPFYRWGPLASRDRVNTLVDEDGFFFTENRIPELLSRISLGELELEFRAQIDCILQSDLHPTHLDSHCDIHLRRADIFELVKDLALEYGLALRVSRSCYIDAMLAEGLAVNSHDDLDSTKVALAEKQATYTRFLRELPEGLSEWALHPGIVNEELKAVTPTWAERAADLEFFTSQETRRIVEEEGIVLLDYGPLQRVWQAKTGVK